MKILVSACLVGDNCKYNGGIKQIYDGTFSGRKIEGQGIFAALCIKAGYKVLDIEDFDYFSHN